MNPNDLSLAKSYDPRLNFNEKKKFTVVTGISSLLPQTNIATGNSTSSVVHTFQTSDAFAFDRRMLLKWYVELTITGTSPGSTLLQLGTNDGIRCMPVSSMISTGQVSFNGKVVSTLLSEYIQALNRYEDLEMANGWTSMSPSMPDQYQTYSDYTVYGVNRNPLARYGVNDSQICRGGHPITVVSDDGTTAVVRFAITEPLRISPLTWNDYDEPALIGVNQINVQLNLNDFSRFWSHAYSSGYTISSISGQFYQNCELQYNLITPDPAIITIDRSKNYFWSYTDIQRYLTNAGSVAKGASSSVTCNSITLNSIPTRCYVYLRQRNADLLSPSTAWLNSDSMAVINSMNITFNGNAGSLSSASQQQLYLMSVKNGLQLSWPQFQGFVGSPVCFAFASDIGLSTHLLAVGSRGNFQLTINVNFTNPITTSNTTPATTINYDMYVIVLSEGILSCYNSNFNTFIGVLDEKDVAMVAQNPAIPYIPYQRARTLYGKGFFDSIGSFFSGAFNKAKDIAKDVYGIAKDTVLPIASQAVGQLAQTALPLAQQYALGKLGLGGAVSAGAVSGGRRGRGRPKGSKNKPKVGGKIPSPDDLISMLEQME